MRVVDADRELTISFGSEEVQVKRRFDSFRESMKFGQKPVRFMYYQVNTIADQSDRYDKGKQMKDIFFIP
jgi:hypothetical protein